MSVAVQNDHIASGGLPQGDFVKFEILWHKDPPMIGPDSSRLEREWRTIMVAGERGVLSVGEESGRSTRIVSAMFQRGGRWYSVTG